MRKHLHRQQEHSPMAVLSELAIEGTSSLVEVQRTLLTLAQQENDIFMNGFKEQMASFYPAAAIADLVRRSVDTLIGMQQEMVTITSKRALEYFGPKERHDGGSTAHSLAFVQEEVDTFVRAHKKLLDVLSEESAKMTRGKRDQHKAKKTEWPKVVHDAAAAFIDAQKRLLDVMGQQMNVNLDVATRVGDVLAPSQLMPLAVSAGEQMKHLVKGSVIDSLFTPMHNPGRKQKTREPQAA